MTLPADLGISSSTARFVAEHRSERKLLAGLIADALRLKLVASAVACGALAALAAPIAHAYHAPLAGPLRAVALAVFGQNLMFLFEGAFAADRQVARNVRMVFGESAVEFSASIVLVLLLGGAMGAATGRAVGYIFGGALGMALGARAFQWPGAMRRRGRPSSSARIARYAAPLTLVDGANALFGAIDLLLIGAYLGSHHVGLFSAPLRASHPACLSGHRDRHRRRSAPGARRRRGAKRRVARPLATGVDRLPSRTDRSVGCVGDTDRPHPARQWLQRIGAHRPGAFDLRVPGWYGAAGVVVGELPRGCQTQSSPHDQRSGAGWSDRRGADSANRDRIRRDRHRGRLCGDGRWSGCPAASRPAVAAACPDHRQGAAGGGGDGGRIAGLRHRSIDSAGRAWRSGEPRRFLLALVVTREVKAAEAANVSRVLFCRISSRG